MEQFHNLGTHLRIQVTGGLIGEDYFGITNDSTGNGHTLALTTRELRRHVAHTMAQSHFLQHFFGQCTTFFGRYLAVKQRKFYIVYNIERINQMEGMENES